MGLPAPCVTPLYDHSLEHSERDFLTPDREPVERVEQSPVMDVALVPLAGPP
jgi:hypothetical protein